jgi:hypothetical protein
MAPNRPRLGFFVPTCVGKNSIQARHLSYCMSLPMSLHHELLCCVCAHGICCRLPWEGAAVTFDPEVTKPTTIIAHHLRSFCHPSEAFFTVLPRDIELGDAEWEAIEHAIRTIQDAVQAKWAISGMQSSRSVGSAPNASGKGWCWDSCWRVGWIYSVPIQRWRTPGFACKRSSCSGSLRQTHTRSPKGHKVTVHMIPSPCCPGRAAA